MINHNNSPLRIPRAYEAKDRHFTKCQGTPNS